MDYLFYCRDKPETMALLQRHSEAHWSFMDQYADRLMARGPSLTADGEQHTGSLHIVSLATIEETQVFAYQEPFYRAGIYDSVTIRRWRNLLDGTMWDFKSSREEPLFLVLAEDDTAHDHSSVLLDLAATHRDRLPVLGMMSSLENDRRAGFAAVIQMPSPAAVTALLQEAALEAGPAFANTCAQAEIHRWRMGGRQ